MEEVETTKESIALTKNAKGEYQWVIKVKDMELLDETTKRLDKINDHLQSKYGNK